MFLSVSLTRLILISSAFLCLISCAEEEHDPTGNATPAAVAESPNASQAIQSQQAESFGADYFQATVLDTPQPNSYEVQVTWAPFKGAVRVLAEGKLVGMFTGEQSPFALTVPGGRPVKLKIEAKKDSQTAAEENEILVQIPLDYVFSGSLNLTQDLHVTANRVFFLPGATVTTLNHNLIIGAQSLVAEGAVIQNFPAHAKALREQNGRHGGAISITAKKAQGQLTVTLRGEDGGDGKIGARRNALIEGASCVGTSGGHGGNSGSLSVNVNDGAGLNLNSESLISNGGVAGIKERAASIPSDDYVIYPCDFNAPNGTNGNPGRAGTSCVKKMADQAPYCK